MTEEQAKRRFFLLGGLRLLGIVMTVFGVQVWQRGAFGFQDETGGKVLALFGVALMFLVPAMLRRRWREGRGR